MPQADLVVVMKCDSLSLVIKVGEGRTEEDDQ
jgi:hypothetical protein